jgi:hypothetical protein
VDVGVRDFTGPQFLMVGSDATINATVFTGTRPVPAAQALVVASGGAEISSVTTGMGSCLRVDATRFNCDFGDLPGAASVPLTVVLHGAAPTPASSFSINAYAQADNNQLDDVRSISFLVSAPDDLSVSTASSLAATAGQQFTVPITLRHTGTLIGGRLQITLPAGVTLNSMSGVAVVCAGTSALDCQVGDWPPSSPFEVDLNLQAANAGSYSIDAKVVAANDNNAANNESNVAVTVSAVATTPPPSTLPPSQPPGGKSSGGGGSIDPTLLGMLALLVILQVARALGSSRAPHDVNRAANLRGC